MQRSLALRKNTLIPWLLLSLSGWLMAADAKPNLSGAWKLNVGKSDFGPLPGPTSRTLKIDHEDPSLKIAVTEVKQQGEVSYQASYTTDGKENVNTNRGNTFRSKLKWDGDVLVIETKGTFAGGEVTARDKWTLSDGGKTLTIERHLASEMGEVDQKLLLEKE